MASQHEFLPAPVSVRRAGGRLDLSSGAALRAAPGWEDFGALLAAWLRPAGIEVVAGAGAGGVAAIELEGDPGIAGAEAYRLDISALGVRIRASAREGAIRAASSLRELALDEGPSLPFLNVEDRPRFAWRGAMLDSARNFQPPDFIEKFLDLMALHKLNRFHWHLTDDQAWRLDIPSLPELARRGSRRLDRRYNRPVSKEGFYSRDEARRIVDFAGERGIVVVPEVETPGHATALLASHPELSCVGHRADGLPFEPEDRYGIFEDILCAGNEAVFDLLARVFDEVAAVFPGPWVHSGGDEVPKARWLACPKCRALMADRGFGGGAGGARPELLQGWFMDRVGALLAERGKRMVGWDEILEGAPRKDALVMSWRGYEGGIEAAKAGHEVVMCPQTKACYLDHKHLDLPTEPGQLGVCTVRDSYSFEPVPPGLTGEEGRRILGGQANLWTELLYVGRQVEYMAFPRLAAIAEVLWSPKEARDWEDFRRRLEVHGRRLDALDAQRYRGPLE